jgi:hypothetical protein
MKWAKRVTKNCEYCGNSFEVMQNIINRGMGYGRFCSVECSRNWKIGKPNGLIGDRNGRWKNGISTDNYHYRLIQIDRYPEHASARYAVRKAIKNGKITRMPCEVCGGLKVDAHHDDYSKPLEVRWLCKKHHREVHNGIH